VTTSIPKPKEIIMNIQTTMLIAATVLSLGLGLAGSQSAFAKEAKDHHVQMLSYGGSYAQAANRNTLRLPVRPAAIVYPDRFNGGDACDLPSMGCFNDKRITN
jgi:hypothetical protein